eukprot:3060894-Rhodomonas_salina.1
MLRMAMDMHEATRSFTSPTGTSLPETSAPKPNPTGTNLPETLTPNRCPAFVTGTTLPDTRQHAFHFVLCVDCGGASPTGTDLPETLCAYAGVRRTFWAGSGWRRRVQGTEPAIVLRVCYALSGTAHCPVLTHALPYVLCDVQYCIRVQRVRVLCNCHALCGTEASSARGHVALCLAPTLSVALRGSDGGQMPRYHLFGRT